MPSETTIGLDKPAAAELRQAAREMAAQQHATLTMSQVVRQLVQAWRQLSATGSVPSKAD